MMQDPVSLVALFSVADYVAGSALILSVFLATRIVEHPPRRHPSTHLLMRRYRREWMFEMAARDVRIFDAQILTTLRQGASFFASTSLIGIGGGAAVLGQVDRVETVARDLSSDLSAPVVVWEVKILIVLSLLVIAFLKFVWSIRLFGYCAIIMAALPNDGSGDRAMAMARRAGDMAVLADRSFTRGLRCIYFSIAGLAWFLGPGALLAATIATLIVIWRREFRSGTRTILMEDPDPDLM